MCRADPREPIAGIRALQPFETAVREIIPHAPRVGIAAQSHRIAAADPNDN